MKICIVMVGVSRPSSKQIIDNIKNNILYFRNTYPIHMFEFVICTYINESYNDIKQYCESDNIMHYFLEPIKDSDIPKELDKYMYPHSPDAQSKNRYRLFYSMEYVLDKIPNKYDVVIRLRIDTEIKSFELVDIQPATYFTVIDTADSCSDNIGYATYDVMKNIWNVKNCFTKALSNEHIVYNAVMKNSYMITQFTFKYILYQDNSEFFNSVKQWSRRNREWSYDGHRYIRGKNIDN